MQVVSSKKGLHQGVRHGKQGQREQASFELSDVCPQEQLNQVW